ncbi:hypothetical protein PG994_014052 [Apiospora phragmitis]|uniref:Uncharacterized protein n=1 Tax=Apiospora phragmitis TaxID=2905665 RepID=A0ABR1T4Y7_9PEZI
MSYTATNGGGGKVSCSKAIGDSETLYLERYEDGRYSIRASGSPGVYLRLDGNAVAKEKKKIGPGAGVSTSGDASNAFESIKFPEVFLRSNGKIVNGQWGSESYEEFYIIYLD